MRSIIRTPSQYLCVTIVAAAIQGQTPKKPAHDFFALDTAMVRNLGKDLLQRSDIRNVAALGYSGIAVVVSDVPQWRHLTEHILPWLDEEKLRLFAVYTGARLDRQSYSLDPELKRNLPALKGRRTIVWLAISSEEFQPSDPAADDLALAAVREAADAAGSYGLRVSIYPHLNYVVERVADAVRIAEKSGRSNVGVTFNLCHWLRTDGPDSMERTLKLAMPLLSLVTINGADRSGKEWIQPLDTGSFDVGALLREIERLGYQGPIGLQGYGVALQYSLDPVDNLRRSMDSWKKLSAR